MKPLVLVFWNICLLRRGPEQVPTAAWFVTSVALADLLMSLLLSLRMDPAFDVLPALTYLLVNMSVIASVTWFALVWLKDFEHGVSRNSNRVVWLRPADVARTGHLQWFQRRAR